MPIPLAFAPKLPTGIAFPIEELVAVRRWAEAHRLRMAVELDHVSALGEFEEMLALYRPGKALRWLTLWRDRSRVVLQPVGREPRSFYTAAEALRALEARMAGRGWLRPLLAARRPPA